MAARPGWKPIWMSAAYGQEPRELWVLLAGVLSPSNPILITDLADLSIGEIDLEYVFR